MIAGSTSRAVSRMIFLMSGCVSIFAFAFGLLYRLQFPCIVALAVSTSANHDLLAAYFSFRGQTQESLRALARLVSLVLLATANKLSYESIQIIVKTVVFRLNCKALYEAF
jgi:hypothetical protein